MGEQPGYSGPSQEEIEEARRMSPEDKLMAGARLFDEECRLLRNEIRRVSPELAPEEVERILCERLDIIHDRAGREFCLRSGLIP